MGIIMGNLLGSRSCLKTVTWSVRVRVHVRVCVCVHVRVCVCVCVCEREREREFACEWKKETKTERGGEALVNSHNKADKTGWRKSKTSSL